MKSVRQLLISGHGSFRDWANEINGVWTTICLICLSVTAFLLPILIMPVICWCGDDMVLQASYVNRRCWDSSKMYALMREEKIPISETDIIPDFIKPYKRLPIILFIQALFFLLPYVLWRSLESCTGMSKTKVMGLAEGYTRLSTQERRDVSLQLARYLNQWLKSDPLHGCPLGTLTIFTVLTKLLFFINSSMQFAAYDIMLKGKIETTFGHEFVRNLLIGNGTRLTQSSSFERTALCDVTIRQLADVKRYTCQCYLQMNTYYEMICVYVWLWLCFVQLITSTSCVYYGLNIIIPIFRTRFVKRHLLASLNLPVQPTDDDIGRFAGSTMGQDGVTVLRWISNVSGDLLVVDTLEHLWLMHHGSNLPDMQFPSNLNRPMADPSCPTLTYPESQT